jgi:hypothetical protein
VAFSAAAQRAAAELATELQLDFEALRLAIPASVDDQLVRRLVGPLRFGLREHAMICLVSTFDAKAWRRFDRDIVACLERLLEAYRTEEFLAGQVLGLTGIVLDREAHAQKTAAAHRALALFRKELSPMRRPPRLDRADLAERAGRALLHAGITLDMAEEGPWSCTTRLLIGTAEGLSRDEWPENVRRHLARAEITLRRTCPGFAGVARPGRRSQRRSAPPKFGGDDTE